MSAATSIEWTDKTWGPTRGCSRVSAGCDNCYAMHFARRFDKPGKAFDGLTRYGPRGVDWSGVVRLVPSALDEPLRWRKPCRVFVNSMSDLFHEGLPDDAIDRVFAVMAMATQHTFQILTKRPARMLAWFNREGGDGYMRQEKVNMRAHEIRPEPGGPAYRAALDDWPLPNVWLGVSVEDQATADERIPLLLQTPAAVRFVSYEPALGPVDFAGIRVITPCDRFSNVSAMYGGDGVPRLDWIIIGGESGPGARPFDVAWARSTIAQCRAAGVPVFVKQLGARPLARSTFDLGEESFRAWDSENGSGPFPRSGVIPSLRSRKGGDPMEWPEDLRVREFPR